MIVEKIPKKKEKKKEKCGNERRAQNTQPADSAGDNVLNRNVNGPVATCSCYYSGSETPPMQPPPPPSRACRHLAACVSDGGAFASTRYAQFSTTAAVTGVRGVRRTTVSTNLKKKKINLLVCLRHRIFFFFKTSITFRLHCPPNVYCIQKPLQTENDTERSNIFR